MGHDKLPAFVRPLILFGAFDRHNFGDLLLGEIAAALIRPQPVTFAGLVERDMSAYGARRVRAITALAREWAGDVADVVHVGGELLTCTLYEAAVMLQTDDEAQAVIARYDADPQRGHAWAARQLGLDQAVAYLVHRDFFRRSGVFTYLGVGGVELDRLPEAARAQVHAGLAAANFVWVRDQETHCHLQMVGVPALLAPDPAELTSALFGTVVREQASCARQAAIHERFPGGYLAVQFSADFGDDATLDVIGRQLVQIHREQGLGIVLFRTGAAPWHDRLDVYRRLVQGTAGLGAVIFEALDIWEICALLAGSCGTIGSSLHARIVAEAFNRPAASLVRKSSERSKVGAYVATWIPGALATVVSPEEMVSAWRQALTFEPGNSRQLQQAIAAANIFREARGLPPL